MTLAIRRKNRGTILEASQHPAGGVLIDLSCNFGKAVGPEGPAVRLDVGEAQEFQAWLSRVFGTRESVGGRNETHRP